MASKEIRWRSNYSISTAPVFRSPWNTVVSATIAYPLKYCVFRCAIVGNIASWFSLHYSTLLAAPQYSVRIKGALIPMYVCTFYAHARGVAQASCAGASRQPSIQDGAHMRDTSLYHPLSPSLPPSLRSLSLQHCTTASVTGSMQEEQHVPRSVALKPVDKRLHGVPHRHQRHGDRHPVHYDRLEPHHCPLAGALRFVRGRPPQFYLNLRNRHKSPFYALALEPGTRPSDRGRRNLEGELGPKYGEQAAGAQIPTEKFIIIISR
jgi:hypothetical protein